MKPDSERYADKENTFSSGAMLQTRAEIIDAVWPFISLDEREKTIYRYPEEVAISGVSLADHLVSQAEVEHFMWQNFEYGGEDFDEKIVDEEPTFPMTPEERDRFVASIGAMWVHSERGEREDFLLRFPELTSKAGVHLEDPFEKCPFSRSSFPF